MKNNNNKIDSPNKFIGEQKKEKNSSSKEHIIKIAVRTIIGICIAIVAYIGMNTIIEEKKDEAKVNEWLKSVQKIKDSNVTGVVDKAVVHLIAFDPVVENNPTLVEELKTERTVYADLVRMANGELPHGTFLAEKDEIKSRAKDFDYIHFTPTEKLVEELPTVEIDNDDKVLVGNGFVSKEMVKQQVKKFMEKTNRKRMSK